MAKKPNRSGTTWTERDYRIKGWRQLKVRVSELALSRLADLCDDAEMGRGEMIELLIAGRYADLEVARARRK